MAARGKFYRWILFAAVWLLALALLGACGLGDTEGISPGEGLPIGPAALGSNALATPAAGSTSGAETLATLDALATTSPTPFDGAGLPLCSPSDLSAEARSEGATGTVTLNLVLTNQGNSACALQGPPQVTLIDAGDRPLKLEVVSLCFLCGPNPPGASLPPEPTLNALAPTQTAVAAPLLNGRKALQPGQHTTVFLMWANWCGAIPDGGVRARLALPGDLGSVVANTDLTAGGRCDVPDAPSRLVVSHYQ